MKDKIAVTVATDLNHTYECTSDIIGRAGEGNVSQLKITIPEKLSNYAVYIDFRKPNGEEIRTPQLKVESGVATYDVPQYILADSGELKVQLVFQKQDGTIWKSSKKSYFIQKSINALDDVPESEKEDFMSEAQKLIDLLSGEVSEIAEMLANDPDFVDNVISRMEIPTYVKTIDGRILKFFFGTQAQYNALSVDEKENLFAIITDDTTREAVVAMIEDFPRLKIDVDNIKNELPNMTAVLDENTRDINDLKHDVNELDTFWNGAPTNQTLSMEEYALSTYLTFKGYYLIQAELQSLGKTRLLNFGLVYWGGTHTIQITNELYVLYIKSDGEMSIQYRPDNEDLIDTCYAKFYIRKFASLFGG